MCDRILKLPVVTFITIECFNTPYISTQGRIFTRGHLVRSGELELWRVVVAICDMYNYLYVK